MRSMRFLPLTVPRLGRKPARGAGAWDFETIPNSLGPPTPATTKCLSPDRWLGPLLPVNVARTRAQRGCTTCGIHRALASAAVPQVGDTMILNDT